MNVRLMGGDIMLKLNSRAGWLLFLSLFLVSESLWASVFYASRISRGGVLTRNYTASNWIFNQPGPDYWYAKAKARFCHPWPKCTSFLGPNTSGIGNKEIDAPQNRGTAYINDPDGSGARGRAEATVDSDPGLIYHSYDFTLTAIAEGIAGPPRHETHTRAWLVDPLGLGVGTVDTSINHSQTLYSGSQVQSPPNSEGPSLEMTILGRFGLGAFSDDPDTFWNDIPPNGVFDLYSIRIFQDIATSMIDVSVDFFDTSTLGFGISYFETESEIANKIRNADWSLSGNVWTLQEDLLLVDLLVTNLSPANEGESATIGTMIANDAVAVPAPGVLWMLCIGMLPLVVSRYTNASARSQQENGV
jgi:hypothetical protein